MRWVKLCIITVSFSVLVNGRPQGEWFQPQRGVRQGSPLVLPLFILDVDALAICTTSMCSWGYLLGFQTAGTPEGIPLLQYADDTTFFILGSEIAVRTLSSMDIFSDFSRLQLNRAQSIFMGFGFSIEEASRCVGHLTTPIGALPVQYLGMPLANRRLWVQDWQPVLEKVDAKMRGGRACMLLRGG